MAPQSRWQEPHKEKQSSLARYTFNRYACLIVVFTVSKYCGNITHRKYQTVATAFQNSAE